MQNKKELSTENIIQLLNDCGYWIEAMAGSDKEEEHIQDMLKGIDIAIEMISFYEQLSTNGHDLRIKNK
jgi:hypothetical protein